MTDTPAIPSFRKASRLDAVEVSEIVRIAEAVRARQAKGEDLIVLSTGEPDFDTPDHIKEAATAAMARGETKYPATVGTLALREAIAGKFERENGFTVGADEVIVSNGAKQVIFNAFMASLDPGDEVIIPAPYWTSYPDMVRVAGGVSVIVPSSDADGFKLTPQALEAAITPKTRWLLLNTPNNPTGSAYNAEELAALAGVLERHPHVWVMADEIYEHLTYGNFVFTSMRRAAPQLSSRMLIINGVSKAYAMTGWRIGYGAGPKDLIKAMTAVQGQICSGACSIAQAAAHEALTGPQDSVERQREIFRLRRDTVVDALNAVDGIECQVPPGAFYVFPSIAKLLGSITPEGEALEDDAAFCSYLLGAGGVGVVPGRAFGAPGHFRLSYAYGLEDLKEACHRIAGACATLTQRRA